MYSSGGLQDTVSSLPALGSHGPGEHLLAQERGLHPAW